MFNEPNSRRPVSGRSADSSVPSEMQGFFEDFSARLFGPRANLDVFGKAILCGDLAHATRCIQYREWEAPGTNALQIISVQPSPTADKVLEVIVSTEEFPLKKFLQQANEHSDDEYHNTPLHNMIVNEQYPRCFWLLAKLHERGIAPDEVADSEGKTIALLAAKMGNERLAIEIYRTFPLHNINHCDRQGRSALHYACMLGLEELINYLLLRDADPTIQDKSGKMPAAYLYRDIDRNIIIENYNSVSINSDRAENASSNQLQENDGYNRLRIGSPRKFQLCKKLATRKNAAWVLKKLQRSGLVDANSVASNLIRKTPIKSISPKATAGIKRYLRDLSRKSLLAATLHRRAALSQKRGLACEFLRQELAAASGCRTEVHGTEPEQTVRLHTSATEARARWRELRKICGKSWKGNNVGYRNAGEDHFFEVTNPKAIVGQISRKVQQVAAATSATTTGEATQVTENDQGEETATLSV